jgi:para-aminobenzoate synthetase
MLKAKALIHAMLMATQGEFDPNQSYIQATEAEVVDSYKKVWT